MVHCPQIREPLVGVLRCPLPRERARVHLERAHLPLACLHGRAYQVARQALGCPPTKNEHRLEHLLVRAEQRGPVHPCQPGGAGQRSLVSHHSGPLLLDRI